MAAISGSVAEAYYGGVPAGIPAEARERLEPDLLEVVEGFSQRFL